MGKSLGDVVFIDLGTHDGLELRALSECSAIRKLLLSLPAIIHAESISQGIRSIKEYLRFDNSAISCQDIHVIGVDPFINEKLCDLMSLCRFKSFSFENSCVSKSLQPLTKVYLANDSLGNSLVPVKPGLTGHWVVKRNRAVKNFFESLLQDFEIKSSRTKYILRMNIEGIEPEIIDYLADLLSDNSSLAERLLLLGSLGDIQKCFGKSKLAEYEHKLETLGISLKWFTSNPNSWPSSLRSIERFING